MVMAAVRPRGTREWTWACGGAAILIVAGAEPWHAALRAIGSQWNVLLFILGLMGISAAAEESGAFALVARFVLRYGAGSLRRLFVVLFFAGALLTALLSNDATAIVFTPVVYRAMRDCGIDAMPFLFGCIFVADTASFGLPFANPANVIVLPRPDIAAYLQHLAVPQLAAIGINLVLFLFIFRRHLRGRYTQACDEEEGPAPPTAARTLMTACTVVCGYVVALAWHLPLGPVACIGAVATTIAARAPVGRVARRVSWSTFALLAALFVLVDAIAHAGFFSWALGGLDGALARGRLQGIALAAVGAALLSVLLNNLPVAVGASYATAHASWPHIAYALLAGVDLGPNLTTTGSLATILWMVALRQRGVVVRPLEYLKLGLVVVPPMLAVTILWLWLVR